MKLSPNLPHKGRELTLTQLKMSRGRTAASKNVLFMGLRSVQLLEASSYLPTSRSVVHDWPVKFMSNVKMSL